jgi:hypothetical protein
MCGDGLFFEVPPLASDALLKTLHAILRSLRCDIVKVRALFQDKNDIQDSFLKYRVGTIRLILLKPRWIVFGGFNAKVGREDNFKLIEHICRWENNVKMVPKEVGFNSVKWIHLAQDGVQR